MVKGQEFGRMARFDVGPNNVMLHLEMYRGDAFGKLSDSSNELYSYVNSVNYGRRSDLLNPTFVYDIVSGRK